MILSRARRLATKRVLKWVGGVILLLAIAAGGVWYTAFSHNRPIVDGQQVAPGVETVKDGFVSVFVLDAGPGKVALVDAGNDKAGKAIMAALARRNLTPESVVAVFLTHGHGDHTAACRRFPGAELFALQDEVARIGEDCKVTHPLKDGEAVDLGDLHVETFAVPGHTSGSAVFLARGVLIFGDSAGASKDGTVMKAVSLFSSSSAQNVDSLKALEARLEPRAAEIKALAFAHTGPHTGFAPLKAFASSH
jgi:hydroxyacylglutathione hydrolase